MNTGGCDKSPSAKIWNVACYSTEECRQSLHHFRLKDFVTTDFSKTKVPTPMANLTHFDDDGAARMVDVGEKPPTSRMARASALVEMLPETLNAIREGEIGKGDVLQVARIAGVMASKQTPQLIPLCHQLAITSVDIQIDFVSEKSIRIESKVRAFDRTGVEMEALVAASTAALTIYDMCKAIDREMQVGLIQLIEKTGGKSGHFVRSEGSD